jgi:hypothetical protein
MILIETAAARGEVYEPVGLTIVGCASCWAKILCCFNKNLIIKGQVLKQGCFNILYRPFCVQCDQMLSYCQVPQNGRYKMLKQPCFKTCPFIIKFLLKQQRIFAQHDAHPTIVNPTGS